MIVASRFAAAMCTFVPLTLVACVLLASRAASQPAAEGRGVVSVDPCFTTESTKILNIEEDTHIKLPGRWDLDMSSSHYKRLPVPDEDDCRALLSKLRSQVQTTDASGMHTFEAGVATFGKGWVHGECMFAPIVDLKPLNRAVEFQVNLPKALDWFNKELDDVRSGDSEFIKTYNAVRCECQKDQVSNPEPRDELVLGIFYDPDQAGYHTAV